VGRPRSTPERGRFPPPKPTYSGTVAMKLGRVIIRPSHSVRFGRPSV
jgi:hypothetical protein